MKHKGYIFIVATAGILSSIFAIKRGLTSPPPPPLIVQPTEKPYPKAIAAAGIIEALGENIHVGSHESGVVQEVYIHVHDFVQKGAPLFKLDSTSFDAELKVAEAKIKVSQAQQAQLSDQLSRLKAIQDSRATSREEIRSKEHALAIAEATTEQMQQEKNKIIALLNRLTVRAPTEGVVLQKNVQVGQYLLATNTDHPPAIIGNIRQLQIRVDIDEYNASRLHPATAAMAYPKNRPRLSIPLTYLRTEPYVIPKLSLTGSSKEKVDTRVLQVIYTFDPPLEASLFVGQQVDVYIQHEPSTL